MLKRWGTTVALGLLLLLLPLVAQAPDGSGEAARYRVITNRGEFTMQLFDVLCVDSAQEFGSRLAFGYYDGAVFARRPAGRVLQLGALRNGELAPECSFKPGSTGGLNLQGTVSWALPRGSDQAGYQFFINLTDNPQLNHRFSVFAEVVDGFDLVVQLRPGDVIERIVPLKEH